MDNLKLLRNVIPGVFLCPKYKHGTELAVTVIVSGSAARIDMDVTETICKC